MEYALNHGQRLSKEAYERQIIALYANQPPTPSKEQDRRLRRKSLDLAIDYRLGCDFPQPRRDALWAVQEKLERKRLRFFFKYLLLRLFASDLRRDASGLAQYVVNQYATILSKAECDAFFGANESRNPALPIENKRW